MRVATLYLASLKIALRYLAVLLAALLALIALVLVGLPRELFSANDIPGVSLAVVYGDGSNDDTLARNLNAELNSLEVVQRLVLCTEDEAETLLANGEVSAILLLPDDTLDVLVYGGHVTITVRANDPLIGTVVYLVADRAVETLDEVQNYLLIYQQAAREHYPTAQERDSAVRDFSLVLIGEAFSRVGNVDNPSPVSPYYAQVLTLLLFLAVSIGSFFVAVIASRQYAQGYVRHLYTRGVRFGHLFAAQLLLGMTIALVLGLVLGLILGFVGEGLSLPALLASSMLLSLVLTALYLVFSGFRQQQQPQVATTRTLIGSLAVMFFLLFAGGGFYPTGLMQLDLRLFNPTWLANQFAVWALGGSLELFSLALFVLPLAICGAAGYLEWRRSL